MDPKIRDQFAQATALIKRRDFEHAIELGWTIQHPTAKSLVLGVRCIEIKKNKDAHKHLLIAHQGQPTDLSTLENLVYCRAVLNDGCLDRECEAMIN